VADMTPEELRAKIEAAPDPCNGPRPWDRDMKGEDAYSMVAEALAKALLITADSNPNLLDTKVEENEDPSGFAAAQNDKLWAATLERFPGLSEWLGGPTGFQYGWAHSAVRYIKGSPQVGNPAIVSVGNAGG
jgi:hypothetical protein